MTVISRAAETKPDEVIVLHGHYGGWVTKADDYTGHRLTITFPNGGDTGTVTRKRL